MTDSTTAAAAGSWSDLVAAASPLFKWAGGKQRFLWENRDRIPRFPGRYIEPFAGGLSVLFHVARRADGPVNAIASDANLRLIRCYQDVKRDWKSVADGLRQLGASYAAAADKSEYYYRLREEYNKLGPSAGAARFIFLMTAGFNGIYRVNQQGQFNVPHGVIRDTVPLPSDETLAAVAAVFQHTELRASSWESTLSTARAGDFVFLDPPYFTDNRTQLYSNSFGIAEQTRLADALVDLAHRDVQFLLTNSNYPEMRELYASRGLSVETIAMHRSISSKIDSRGAGDEIVVTPRDTRLRKLAEAELALRIRIAASSRKREAR